MVRFAVSKVARTKCNATPIEGHPITTLKEFANEGCKDIVQGTHLGAVVASESGFVRGVIEAYNHHHDLVLRPDDIWLAILIQFGLYVEGNAEELRSSLVKHRGQKKLVVTAVGSLHSVDYGALAKQMVSKMEQHLVDPSLKHWVLPSFSTTTDHDVIVGSVVLMATMKKYFSYNFSLSCGLPHVTLLGTVDDWLDTRRRLDKLPSFGARMVQWTAMLAPILDQFVAAAQGQPDVAFWDRICHRIGGGSGPSYLSGWLSAFCVFNDKGEWQGDKMTNEEVERVPRGDDGLSYRIVNVAYDYPLVEIDDLAPGYLTVDVSIDDNGRKHKALLFAGHMSFGIGADKATIAPQLSWALALKNGKRAKPSAEEKAVRRMLDDRPTCTLL